MQKPILEYPARKMAGKQITDKSQIPISNDPKRIGISGLSGLGNIMTIRKLSIPFLVLMLVGCLTVKEIKDYSKMNKFAPTAESYEKAIQWSDFEAASFFAKSLKSKPDLNKLKNIKVISYEVKRITHQREQLKVLQTIDLSYYIKDRLKEKSLRYQEVWEYDEMDGSWYLISGFPEFEWD